MTEYIALKTQRVAGWGWHVGVRKDHAIVYSRIFKCVLVAFAVHYYWVARMRFGRV